MVANFHGGNHTPRMMREQAALEIIRGGWPPRDPPKRLWVAHPFCRVPQPSV